MRNKFFLLFCILFFASFSLIFFASSINNNFLKNLENTNYQEIHYEVEYLDKNNIIIIPNLNKIKIIGNNEKHIN